MKHNFRNWLVKPVSVILAAVMLLGLTGCNSLYTRWVKYRYSEERISRDKDLKSWDEEKSIPIAQSYLEEKYGEEFIYATRCIPPHPYPKDLVAVCEFIKKDDAQVENPAKYDVDVVYKAGEYRVIGDSYMFVHIQKVAEDFLRPYVENRFSDIEFVFFVYSANTTCGALGGEYFADAKIPQNFDELYDVTHAVHFKVIVPISEDGDKVSEACSLLKSDLEDLNCEIEIDGWIDVYQNKHFAEISQSPDPRRDAWGCYSREEII